MNEVLPSVTIGAIPQVETLPSLAASIREIVGRLFVRDLVRYGICSALALTVDWGTLVVVMSFGAAPLVAAGVGFVCGLTLSYLLSISFVFPDRRHSPPLQEALAFVGIGLAGLGVNQLMLWVFIHEFSVAAAIAKGPTAIVVFLFNFVLRRTMLFYSTQT